MMQLRIYNIDIEIDKMVGQLKTMVFISMDSDLMSDTSETCCRQIAETIKNLAKTINENL